MSKTDEGKKKSKKMRIIKTEEDKKKKIDSSKHRNLYTNNMTKEKHDNEIKTTINTFTHYRQQHRRDTKEG